MKNEWEKRWQDGRIGFHEEDVHPDLKNFEKKFLGDGPHHVLVPLCGKSVDMNWLVAQGHIVVGVELVALAVEQFFAARNETPAVEKRGSVTIYRGDRIDIHCGDFFETSPLDIGLIDRVWDRAALVALSDEDQERYAAKIKQLCPKGLLLQNAVEYDKSVMEPPPNSVSEATIIELYGNAKLLRREDILSQEPRWRERGHSYFYSTAQLIEL